MKAVWYERTGAAQDVLTYGDMPTPQAGPGEVRVRLEAVSYTHLTLPTNREV